MFPTLTNNVKVLFITNFRIYEFLRNYNLFNVTIMFEYF